MSSGPEASEAGFRRRRMAMIAAICEDLAVALDEAPSSTTQPPDWLVEQAVRIYQFSASAAASAISREIASRRAADPDLAVDAAMMRSIAEDLRS